VESFVSISTDDGDKEEEEILLCSDITGVITIILSAEFNDELLFLDTDIAEWLN